MRRSKPKAEAPDPEFSKGVIEAFLKGGKPSPTPRQILALQRAIPDGPGARVEFVPYLCEKMPRLKHPGSLPNIAEEFTAAWPVLAAQEQALRSTAQPSGPRVLTVEGVRRHLNRCAAQLGQGYEVIITKLEQLATQANLKIDAALESVLQDLDVRLKSIAESSVTDTERKKFETIPAEMPRSFRMMTTQQQSVIKRQLFERALIESRKLPRLSLLNLESEDEAQSAGGND